MKNSTLFGIKIRVRKFSVFSKAICICDDKSSRTDMNFSPA